MYLSVLDDEVVSLVEFEQVLLSSLVQRKHKCRNIHKDKQLLVIWNQ